jgi:hypothetical protein
MGADKRTADGSEHRESPRDAAGLTLRPLLGNKKDKANDAKSELCASLWRIMHDNSNIAVGLTR